MNFPCVHKSIRPTSRKGCNGSIWGDVTGFIQDLVGTLTVDVDKTFIAPKALPIWLAGFRRLEAYATRTPEHQGPRRLAYL